MELPHEVLSIFLDLTKSLIPVDDLNRILDHLGGIFSRFLDISSMENSYGEKAAMD